MNNRSETRKGGFNLDKFYQNIQRVENSLGKKQHPRSNNSSAVKHTQAVSQQPERIQYNLAALKSQLNTRKLTKTRINLDMPYEQYKIKRTQNKQSKQSVKQLKQDEFSEGAHEPEEKVDHFQQVRDKLMSWKCQQNHEQVKENRKLQIKKNYKSKYNILDKNKTQRMKNSFEYLQKTMETPSNEMLLQQPIIGSNTTSKIIQKLLTELSKRNIIYKQLEKNVYLQRSYFQRTDEFDLSIKFQQNIREHELMLKIIEQFKRICGLQMNDLSSLHSFLKQSNKYDRSVSRVHDQQSDEIILVDFQ